MCVGGRDKEADYSIHVNTLLRCTRTRISFKVIFQSQVGRVLEIYFLSKFILYSYIKYVFVGRFTPGLRYVRVQAPFFQNTYLSEAVGESL